MHIASAFIRASRTTCIAETRETDVAAVTGPPPTHVRFAATGDKYMMKAFTDVMRKVTEELMIIEGPAAASYHLNAAVTGKAGTIARVTAGARITALASPRARTSPCNTRLRAEIADLARIEMSEITSAIEGAPCLAVRVAPL